MSLIFEAMSRRKITQDLYDALLTAYRERPNNHSNAARVAGCDRRMARRAWCEGGPSAPWAVPIRQAIELEQVEARSVRASSRTAEFLAAEEIRERARRDAIEARGEEGQLVRLARRATLDLMAQTVQTIEAARAVTNRLHDSILEGATDSLSPGQCLALMDKLSKTAASAVSTGQAVMRMERLHMGEPEAIVSVDMGGVSTQDLGAELREIENTLKLIDGGNASEDADALGAVIEVG